MLRLLIQAYLKLRLPFIAIGGISLGFSLFFTGVGLLFGKPVNPILLFFPCFVIISGLALMIWAFHYAISRLDS